MKNITLLLLTTILTATVSLQAQTVQKDSLFLKSHVIKKQDSSTTKKDSLAAGPLSIKERLMIVPTRNDVYSPFKVKVVKIKHKLLFEIINSAAENWYTNKYDIDNFRYEWFHSRLQQFLSQPLPVNPGNGTLFRSTNKRWIQY
jgi:hypothetical protein